MSLAQNKDLVADAQTLLEENLSEKKSVESARRLVLSDNCTETTATFSCNMLADRRRGSRFQNKNG